MGVYPYGGGGGGGGGVTIPQVQAEIATAENARLILRSNATTGAQPTALEWASPTNGDVARVTLSDGVVENWLRSAGAWTLHSTLPVGGGGGTVDAWTAATPVTAGVLRRVTFSGTEIVVRSLSSRTTGATYDAAEAANWLYVSQAQISAFSASAAVNGGVQILQDGVTYTRAATGTTAASFAADTASWTAIGKNFTEVVSWAATTTVRVNEIRRQTIQGAACLIRTNFTRVTGATFDGSEATSWQLVSHPGVGTFAANQAVLQGIVISVNGKLYRRTSAAGTTLATFAADLAAGNWVLAGTTFTDVPAWTASTPVQANELRYQGIFGVPTIMRSLSARTTNASFDAAEAGNWSIVSQETYPSFSASLPVIAGFRIMMPDGKVYVRNSTGTSLASWPLDRATGEWFVESISRTAYETIGQTGHGLAVGDWIRVTAADTYGKAQANSAGNADVVGVVSEVIDANAFTVQTGGIWTGASGLTPASAYFLSATTAGAITDTAPSGTGEINKPVGLAINATSLWVTPQERGMVIDAASTVTPISLQRNKVSLASSFTLTADSVFQNSGLTITTPAGGGTFEVGYDVRGVVPTNAANRFLYVRLFDVTGGVAVADSDRNITASGSAPDIGSASFKAFVTLAGARQYRVEVAQSPGSAGQNGAIEGMSAIYYNQQPDSTVVSVPVSPTEPIRTETANYTAQAVDGFIVADTTGGNVTVTLPGTLNAGKRITVHKSVAANTLTVSGTLVTTAGAAGSSEAFTAQFSTIPYIWTGSRWAIYA